MICQTCSFRMSRGPSQKFAAEAGCAKEQRYLARRHSQALRESISLVLISETCAYSSCANSSAPRKVSKQFSEQQKEVASVWGQTRLHTNGVFYQFGRTKKRKHYSQITLPPLLFTDSEYVCIGNSRRSSGDSYLGTGALAERTASEIGKIRIWGIGFRQVPLVTLQSRLATVLSTLLAVWNTFWNTES